MPAEAREYRAWHRHGDECHRGRFQGALGEGDETNVNIKQFIQGKFSKSVTYVDGAETATLIVDRSMVEEVALALKNIGFNHFSDVTVVDYLEEEEFELIYHLWSHGSHTRLMMKTRLPRSDPVIKSFTPIWRSAHMHERECHEMFGIVFEGHRELTPLLLEDWEGIPPLRKDFDSRQYVLDKFYGGERE